MSIKEGYEKHFALLSFEIKQKILRIIEFIEKELEMGAPSKPVMFPLFGRDEDGFSDRAVIEKLAELEVLRIESTDNPARPNYYEISTSLENIRSIKQALILSGEDNKSKKLLKDEAKTRIVSLKKTHKFGRKEIMLLDKISDLEPHESKDLAREIGTKALAQLARRVRGKIKKSGLTIKGYRGSGYKKPFYHLEFLINSEQSVIK